MEETKDIVPIPERDFSKELSISRSPEIVLEEARRAAAALQGVISSKKKKVMMHGEQYLEAEDWQTIGKFYNVTAKIEWTKFVEYGQVKGFEARAVVIHINTGREISAAEAMCMNDEATWRGKPMNQLRSMAQTRALSKALRMVLSWVVVMAGYKPTPAEEMDGIFEPEVIPPNNRQTEENSPVSKPNVISAAQRKRFWAMARSAGKTEEEMRSYLIDRFGIEHTSDITRDIYEEVCLWAAANPKS